VHEQSLRAVGKLLSTRLGWAGERAKGSGETTRQMGSEEEVDYDALSSLENGLCFQPQTTTLPSTC
jgi:hypothetical protein